jgi:hypothetical protein
MVRRVCPRRMHRASPAAVVVMVRWGQQLVPLPSVLCLFRYRVRVRVRVSTLHLLFRFEIEFLLLFFYPRLDLRPSMAPVPLIDYGDHLGTHLAGYGTVTLCVYK